VGGNPVSFDELASLLERAEQWLAADWSATGSGSAGSPSSHYNDQSKDQGRTLARFDVAHFLSFRAKGPTICLAHPIGLGVR
jgi:hypothetical protein